MEDIINGLFYIGGGILAYLLIHIFAKIMYKNYLDETSIECYNEMLFNLLDASQINTIKKAYYLCDTNATPKNLKDIYMFIRFRLYFLLEEMSSRKNEYGDEYGDFIHFDPKLYKIFLIIDNFNNYKLIIVFEDMDQGFDSRIEDIIKVNRFLMWSTLWYFDKALIYKA